MLADCEIKKPNLFQIATKELSQDGFLTWLIQWADDCYRVVEPELNAVAKDFVRMLIRGTPDFDISRVEAGRQWEHIDIWAEINGSIAIIIEDKKDAEEHGDQLFRYLETAKSYYLSKGFELYPIYLKTGNYSLSQKKIIEAKGYRAICRNDILQVLCGKRIDNAIVRDFIKYIQTIEDETNNYNTIERIRTSWYGSEGFFLRLEQELLPEWSDWRYVSNPSGGFQGFWYHWNETEVFPEIYIQIENSDKGIILVVKVAKEDGVPCESLYGALPVIQEIAQQEGLSLSKPSRYRSGATSTLAVVDHAFPESGTLSIELFIKTLRALERTIDRFCQV